MTQAMRVAGSIASQGALEATGMAPLTRRTRHVAVEGKRLCAPVMPKVIEGFKDCKNVVDST